MSPDDWTDRLAELEAQMLRQVEADTAKLMPRVEEEAARLQRRADAEAAQAGREGSLFDDEGDEDDEMGEDLEPLGYASRRDFVPKEQEDRYLTRDANGLPTLRLVDTGHRLVITTPLAGGAVINPRGPGLRRFGLYTTPARGWNFNRAAYRAADLRKGRWVDLLPQPTNRHDPNAVALCSPGSRSVFGYVQRGKARAVGKLIESGKDVVGLSLRGPGPGNGEDTCLLLIGSRSDLTAMLGQFSERA
jgi:hypothetical protein